MGVALSQCQEAPVCQTTCKADGLWKGDGCLELEQEDDPHAAEGDVKNSQAMINHLLLKAARDGDVSGISTALSRGAFVETRRPFVMTPESAVMNKTAVQRRGHGLTPVMYASQGGYPDAVKALINAGACVNAEDEDGLRALHFAASAGCIDTCELLIAAGAEVEARDDDGRTVLEHVPGSDLTTHAERTRWATVLRAPMPVAQGEPDEPDTYPEVAQQQSHPSADLIDPGSARPEQRDLLDPSVMGRVEGKVSARKAAKVATSDTGGSGTEAPETDMFDPMCRPANEEPAEIVCSV
eukprot:gnl/TRDRNA2_/TRDRNA2_177023_c2_seq4.p1 gnl/TRDRNA2_/TRDRNA2_177023_c2~~gnl/TRDRNA2_/TRDRNA2_177023_c2_seq4.p1  ORF type:complete len:297 (+),score=55.33 gnl/TRDRNA2_/TRDRNA2_177023_c2_seq4:134-1024(+)